MIRRIIRHLNARSRRVHPLYRVVGAETYNHRNLAVMKRPNLIARPMEAYVSQLLEQIRSAVESRLPLSVLRCNDGEAYFLRGEFHGNILKRHFTAGGEVDLQPWRKDLERHETRTFHTDPELRSLWKPLVPQSSLDDYVPLEAVYALIASRRLFPLLADKKVGIIGPARKIALIADLMTEEAYRDYLQTEPFSGYLAVPETGASNDPHGVAHSLAEDAGSKRCDVYLYGMGIAKLRVIPMLRELVPAVYVDIGCALDALAGIVPKDREYFGAWVNYRHSQNSLEGIDLLTPKRSSRDMRRFPVAEDVTL